MQVARLYYIERLNQTEIGHQLNTSRSTVSRLLQEAHDRGIVKISIEYPWDRDEELEKKLMDAFGLRAARVLVAYNQDQEEIRRGMGKLAADYFDQVARDNMVVALSNGRSVASTIEQIKPTRRVNLTVVQMIGALGSGSPFTDGPYVVRNLAEAYGGQYRYMHTPLLVEDLRTREYLMQESMVQETLTLARQADIALLGIGALGKDAAGTIFMGFLDSQEIAWLKAHGATGHMCAQHYDVNGEILDVEINRRVIGMGIDALRDIDSVIAIAGGEDKAHAILGAIRGGYLNILVTDDQAAQKVLELEAADVHNEKNGLAKLRAERQKK
jgi:DNA-binding transcriptional regulator LsrR (DeoR family)